MPVYAGGATVPGAGRRLALAQPEHTRAVRGATAQATVPGQAEVRSNLLTISAWHIL